MSDHVHHHTHNDHGGHHDQAAFTETNRAHWNQFAANYNKEQWQKDMINDVTSFILSNVTWIGLPSSASSFESPSPDRKPFRVLDYACGPGTITAAFGSHATSYIGVDNAENMVKAYNTRFSAEIGGDLEEKLDAHALVANLIDPADPRPSALSGPEFWNFDIVVVGLGYHHFQDLDLATKRMVERLKPGGTFLITDLKAYKEEEGDAAKHTIAHTGFSEETVKGYFERAGLVDFDTRVMDKEILLRGTMRRTVFMARGRKPESVRL